MVKPPLLKTEQGKVNSLPPAPQSTIKADFNNVNIGGLNKLAQKVCTGLIIQ